MALLHYGSVTISCLSREEQSNISTDVTCIRTDSRRLLYLLMFFTIKVQTTEENCLFGKLTLNIRTFHFDIWLPVITTFFLSIVHRHGLDMRLTMYVLTQKFLTCLMIAYMYHVLQYSILLYNVQ